MTLACKEAFVVNTCWKSSFLSPGICRWRIFNWVCLSIFLSIHLIVHPSFHRYNGGVYRGFWDTGYLPFFFLGYEKNYPFQFHGYVMMGYCVQYFCYCQGYWIFRNKTWGYLPVHRGYLPVYFKDYCCPHPPPSKQASTMQRDF